MSSDYLSPEIKKIIREYKPLTKEGEAKLVKKGKLFDLVKHNMRFGIKRALEIAGGDRCLTQEDVTQCAFIGLWKATQTFDPKKNVKFITYARFFILTEVMEFMSNTNWATCISRSAMTQASRIKREASREGCSVQEASDRLEISPDGLRMVEFLENHISLSLQDETKGKGVKKEARVDWDPQFPTTSQDEDHKPWENSSRYNFIIKLMDDSNISHRDQLCIRLRFGLDQADPMTYRDMAPIFGICQQAVQMIVKRTLKKLGKEKFKPQELV